MTASQTLAQGIVAYKDGRYLDALLSCEQALDEATSAEQLEVSIYALHLWLAEICLQVGDFRKSQKFVDNACKCANKEIEDTVNSNFAAVADIASVQWRLDSVLGRHDEAESHGESDVDVAERILHNLCGFGFTHRLHLHNSCIDD